MIFPTLKYILYRNKSSVYGLCNKVLINTNNNI